MSCRHLQRGWKQGQHSNRIDNLTINHGTIVPLECLFKVRVKLLSNERDSYLRPSMVCLLETKPTHWLVDFFFFVYFFVTAIMNSFIHSFIHCCVMIVRFSCCCGFVVVLHRYCCFRRVVFGCKSILKGTDPLQRFTYGHGRYGRHRNRILTRSNCVPLRRYAAMHYW